MTDDADVIEPDDGPIREDERSWGDRLLIERQTLSPRHRKLCELAAQGIPNKDIAKQLNYTDSRVSILLTNTNIKNEVDRIRERIYEDTIGRRLKDMAKPALDELDRCLADTSNRYKETLKVDVAKWLVEKIDGKAIQKHDIGENLLSVMMDRLDALKRSGGAVAIRASEQQQAIDVTPIQDQEPAIKTLKTEEDLLSDWCTEFTGVKKS